MVAVSDVLEEDALLWTDLPIFNDLMRKATEERTQAFPAVMAMQTRNARQQQQQQQEKEDLATEISGASIIPNKKGEEAGCKRVCQTLNTLFFPELSILDSRNVSKLFALFFCVPVTSHRNRMCNSDGL